MRPAKPPKLPGHLTPLQKHRLRLIWRQMHDPDSQLIRLLKLPGHRFVRYLSAKTR